MACNQTTPFSVRFAVLILLQFCSFYSLLRADAPADLIIDEENWHEEIGLERPEETGNTIRINTAESYELRLIPGISDEDIRSIISSRNSKPIRNLEDLQSIGFSDEKIKSILPYISFELSEEMTTISSIKTPRKVSLPLSLYQSQRSYIRSYSGETSARYYQKTEVRNQDTVLGFVTLSNYGSRALARNHSYYFNHQTEKKVQQVVIGKYRLSLGQGIAFASKSGFSKSSAATTHPVKNYTPLRSHTNPYKLWSMEGFAAHIVIPPLEFIPFYSETELDASIKDEKISTFYPYGTDKSEFRNSVGEKISGLAVKVKNRAGSGGLYYSRHKFDRVFLEQELSNNYNSKGFFINFKAGEIDLLGEYARLGGRTGIVAALRWGKSPFRQLLLYRQYDRYFPHWHGNPFSSQANFDNERGVYYGLRIVPYPGWTINVYFDIWRHPDTRYFEKMPITRTEQYLQVIYRTSKDTFRWKLHNRDYARYRVFDDTGKIRDENKTAVAWDWLHKVTPNLSITTCLEYLSRRIPEINDFQKGILFFENISWQQKNTRISCRISVYRSAVSHYVYEQSLAGMWESRPLNGDDIYFYLIIKNNLTNSIKLQSKFSYLLTQKTKSLIIQIICSL
jgi:hypothetical protein